MGVLRYLLAAGVAWSALAALYRNDTLLNLARNAGAEDKYLALEQSLVGTPGWGTPRQLEAMVQASKQGIDQSVLARLDRLMSGQPANAAPVPAPQPAKTAEPAAAPAPAESDSGAVSLESLPIAPAEPEPEAAPSKEPAAEESVAKAPSKPARAAVAPKPAARKAASDDPPRKAKPKKVAEAEPARPPPRRKNDSPLNAAIRSAIFKGGN